MIKTGILCVPTYDEAAVAAVRRLLAKRCAPLALLADHHAPMQRYVVEDVLRRWCDEEELDLVVTVGGTLPASGPSGREIVPDATLAVAERQLPGLAETMRALAYKQSPLALLDRGVAAIRGRTLLLNLPAGAAAAALFLGAVVEVIPAVVQHLQDDPTAPQLRDDLDGSNAERGARNADWEPSDAEASPQAEPTPQGPRTLDPAEFAAFLQRSRKG
jgi:molybdopterin biosynthesis enzyme MoaB